MTPPGWSIFARPALHEDVENRCQTPGRSGTRLTRAFRRRRALCQKHERQSGLKGMVWSLGRGSKRKFKPPVRPIPSVLFSNRPKQKLGSLLGTLDSDEYPRAVGVGTACQVRFPFGAVGGRDD